MEISLFVIKHAKLGIRCFLDAVLFWAIIFERSSRVRFWSVFFNFLLLLAHLLIGRCALFLRHDVGVSSEVHPVSVHFQHSKDLFRRSISLIWMSLRVVVILFYAIFRLATHVFETSLAQQTT